jgi:hypothetical protein
VWIFASITKNRREANELLIASRSILFPSLNGFALSSIVSHSVNALWASKLPRTAQAIRLFIPWIGSHNPRPGIHAPVDLRAGFGRPKNVGVF